MMLFTFFKHIENTSLAFINKFYKCECLIFYTFFSAIASLQCKELPKTIDELTNIVEK